MILRLVVRSLLARPVRSAVLAGGFGLGVSVMANLLGVGDVISKQAREPALRGGGDVVVAGAAGRLTSARWMLSSVLGREPFARRVAAASPSQRSALYLVRGGRVVPLRAKGGIPSLERALGDRETSQVPAWVDRPADAAWTRPDEASLLRALDRFHPIPDVPARASSWAEWLYFNGRAAENRFYLTFMVGSRGRDGRRRAGVRLQLDRSGRRTSHSEAASLDEARLLAEAPDLAIGRSRVRLEGLRYHLEIELRAEGESSGGGVRGELVLEAFPGRSLPPFAMRGLGGWVSGYVVPVMSGRLSGRLRIGDETVSFDDGNGYHDHNWGFWEGVTWQWGQVEHEGVSLVYGRVRPPADAADAERAPAFVAVLGPKGPLGYGSEVAIEETLEHAGRPRRIVVTARGPSLDLRMESNVEQAIVTRLPTGAFGAAEGDQDGAAMDFYQMRVRCRVKGEAGGRSLAFEARGAAETFQGR